MGQPTLETYPYAVVPSADDSEEVYVAEPPVVDIESYPAFFYAGVDVYYIGGRWYHRGPRGWAYYRHEAPALARLREERWQHDQEPRWADHGSRGGARLQGFGPSQPDRPGVTEPQGVPASDRTVVPPSTAQPRRKGITVTPAPKRPPPVIKIGPSGPRTPPR